MPKVSLETVYALLKEFKTNTEKHLETLNGQTSKNTKFVQRAKGAIATIIFISGGVAAWIKFF